MLTPTEKLLVITDLAKDLATQNGNHKQLEMIERYEATIIKELNPN